MVALAPGKEPAEPPAASEEEEVERLKRLLKEEQEKAESHLNRLKYLQADFENYRKRAEKEIAEVRQFGNERLIKSLLEVVDELKLATQAGEGSRDREPLLEGVKMTLKKLYAILEGEGLTKIEAVGKPFDPEKHEAVSRVAAKDHPEGMVTSEIREGFMLKGRVIRPSLVEVTANLPESGEQGREELEGSSDEQRKE